VAIHTDFDPTETREVMYLETLEGWIDAEFSLYTLKGHQRGYYPHLYDPVTGGRILRKRKAKEMEPDSSPQVADEPKPKRRTKRTRKTKGSVSPESITESISSPSVDSTLSPPVDMDLDGSPSVPPTNHASPPESAPSPPDLLGAPTRAIKHRRRSSSVTSSGASGRTLVESEGVDAEESRENSPADTAVDSEEVPDAKVFEQVAEKLDVDIISPRSSLSPLESTPPPPPRRSARATKKTQTFKRPSTTSRARSKRVAA